MYTATTNDRGEVEFTLPTRDHRETQVLPLLAELPEYSTSAVHQFVLAAQEYSVTLSTARPCYLSGETFELTAKAVDAEGKPAARRLVLNILEKTDVDGTAGERLVEKKEIDTDKQQGQARVTLALERGGHYILRTEGSDRFDNLITGQHEVEVSADDDQVRLRILADQHTFKVGDQPQIKLHWREEPALALITFQGAKVLGYRLVQLEKGTNQLAIPMTAELAPNFELAVAVMINGPADASDEQKPTRRLHTASSPFTVERDLIVTVQPVLPDGQSVARPGAAMKVTIRTTDPQGKPVDAEVSLAMVEQSLVDRFGDAAPSIGSFFRGQLRETAVRTTASITFDYRPTTRRINWRLLAEAERVAIEQLERVQLGTSDVLVLGGDVNRPAGELFGGYAAEGAAPMAGLGIAAAQDGDTDLAARLPEVQTRGGRRCRSGESRPGSGDRPRRSHGRPGRGGAAAGRG